MKKSEPKKDWRYALMSILSALLFLSIYSYSNYHRIIGMLTIGFTFLHFYQWKYTSYQIKDNVLKIQSGIFRQHIPIRSIHHIELVHNFDILTTLSYRKLKLTTEEKNKTNSYFVSPHHLNQFVEDLAAINPSIKISEAVKELCLFEIYETEMSI